MGDLCFECGDPARYRHHVVPRVRGGTRTVPLCGECHAKAHHMDRRMTTSECTSAALQHKKALGERVGSIPYGFVLAADGVHLVEHPAEQAVLAEARELRAAGLSLRKTATELARRGFVSRTSRTFNATQIKRMMEAAPASERWTPTPAPPETPVPSPAD